VPQQPHLHGSVRTVVGHQRASSWIHARRSTEQLPMALIPRPYWLDLANPARDAREGEMIANFGFPGL
jgi:hypothetical protein